MSGAFEKSRTSLLKTPHLLLRNYPSLSCSYLWGLPAEIQRILSDLRKPKNFADIL